MFLEHLPPEMQGRTITFQRSEATKIISYHFNCNIMTSQFHIILQDEEDEEEEEAQGRMRSRGTRRRREGETRTRRGACLEMEGRRYLRQSQRVEVQILDGVHGRLVKGRELEGRLVL